MSTSYTDVFNGKNITSAFPQYSAISLTGNITLAWPAQFQNTLNVVSVLMDITPDAGSRTVTLPDATEGSVGFAFTINNPSLFDFDVLTNGGATLLTILAQKANLIWLTGVSTAVGTWRNIPAFGGAGAVTSINASSDSNNLVITGVPITTAGTIDFSVQGDLLALSTLAASVGYGVRTAANTWATRSLLGTANQILVTNPTGVAANTSFSLSPNVVITSLTLAGLSFGVVTANTIATTGANVDLILEPNGTGNIALNKNAKLATNKSLKFIGDNGVNYITVRAGNTVVNQDLIWPISASGVDQMLRNDGFGNLSWATVPSFPGATTVNAVARYSNVTGSLKDSPSFIVTDAGAVSGLLSAEIGAFRIATFDSQTILTTGGLDLILRPSGNGAFNLYGDIQVHNSNGLQRQVNLYNLTDGAYAGLRATPGMPVSITWNLPVADGVGYMMSDGLGQLSFLALTTVATNIPQFTNVTGTIGASPISISAGGALTGVASSTFTGMIIGATSNTIATLANANLNLRPNGTGIVEATSDISLLLAATQLKLRLYNSAGTFYTALQAGAAVADRTFTLPFAFPAATGILKSSSAGVMSIDSLGTTAGNLRTDGSGNVAVTTTATAVNQIAKFGDTVGTWSTTLPGTSAAYIDSTSNLSVGTTTIGTSGTGTITLPVGASVTAIGANFLSIATRNDGGGNNFLALYGGGNGGVTASTTNTNTNKIKVYVNGTLYYLLASTSST